ncbi:MAG: enoyl-CoA hydratase [Betaproteobacteria bacterium]|jgi:enoyl-CoA hydratase/carnithine racemase|nr:enoyl-CoA hydratase [Betaproteobacteria bacterium]
MQTYEDVLYEVQDRIAVIRLNRPESLNAFTAAMGNGLRNAVGAAVADPEVRVIVLTGAGRGFCAGADMKLLQGIQGGTTATGSRREDADAGAPDFSSDLGPDVSAHYGGRFGYLLKAKKPIVAALNGPAAGLGFVIALYADLRFAGSEAVFTTSFGQRGLIAEHGCSWLLPRLVGPANALDLLLSARKIGAAEAERIGLVNKVFAQATFMEEVLAYARVLADKVSPRSMAVMKAQVWKSPFQDFATALAVADSEMLASFKSEDFREGVAHYVEKRAPRFKGL